MMAQLVNLVFSFAHPFLSRSLLSPPRPLCPCFAASSRCLRHPLTLMLLLLLMLVLLLCVADVLLLLLLLVMVFAVGAPA